MNTRCFRCGWSFSLSRETIENAVANAGSQKIHVEYCPRCRQVIKIPIQQLRRALPSGWTPESRKQAAEAGPDTAASEMPVAPDLPAASTSEPSKRGASKPAASKRAAAVAAREAGPELAAEPATAGKRPRRTKAQASSAPGSAEEASPATETKTASRAGRPAATKAPAKRTTKKAARKSTDT
jgi:hypothetical protein